MRTALIVFGFVVVIAAVSCQSEQEIDFRRYYSAGSVVFQQHCQNCHGNTGEGLSALMPPLTDSVFLRKNKADLACYLQNGLSSPIKVGPKVYDNKMPPSGLTPVEIAEVLTYVTNSFGNKMGTYNTETVEKNLKTCE